VGDTKEDKMNLNEFAKEICRREGKKKSVDIAQVKEIVRIIGDIFVENGVAPFFKVTVMKCKRRRK
jgi:hypothetical protein